MEVQARHLNAVSQLDLSAQLLWAFAELQHVTVATPELLNALGGEVRWKSVSVGQAGTTLSLELNLCPNVTLAVDFVDVQESYDFPDPGTSHVQILEIMSVQLYGCSVTPRIVLMAIRAPQMCIYITPR